MAKSPVAILYDTAGNALTSIQDGANYFLGIVAKMRNAAGTVINPATDETTASVATALADGSQKVQLVDATGDVVARESSGVPEIYTYSESATYQLAKIRQELTHIRLILSAALEISFEEGEDS